MTTGFDTITRAQRFLAETLRTGDLVYIDSYVGLVPAKVTQIDAPEHSMTGTDITVKVTAKRPGYKIGEEITFNTGFNRSVIARRAVYTRDHKLRVRQLNYTYEPTKKEPADV